MGPVTLSSTPPRVSVSRTWLDLPALDTGTFNALARFASMSFVATGRLSGINDLLSMLIPKIMF